MKTLTRLLTVLVSVAMLAGCGKIDPPDRLTESVMAEVPLNAYFSTEFHKNAIGDVENQKKCYNRRIR